MAASVCFLLNFNIINCRYNNCFEWHMFSISPFSVVIPCELERVVTYFNVYTKPEVIVWENMRLFS